MSIEVGALIGIIGCVVGLAGWLSGRDKKTAADAQWRGEVNGKLDVIVGVKEDVSALGETVGEHSERLAKVEASAASAHKRMDEHLKGDL